MATIKSKQVANELIRLRKAVGLTTGEAGARLGMSQSKISRMETGEVGLKPDDVAALLGLYHVPAGRRDEILDLLREAAKPNWIKIHSAGLPEQWQTLITWEDRAYRLHKFEPFMVPGLLQTADYARAIISSTAVMQREDSELDTRVAARLARQAILSRKLPPYLHVVLHEAALLVPVGEPGVLADQLRRLLELARRPKVTIQVVPFASGPHPGFEGSFLVMEFSKDPTLVYLENRAVSSFLEEEEQVEPYRLAWRRVVSHALTAERSAELIAQRVRDLDGSTAT